MSPPSSREYRAGIRQLSLLLLVGALSLASWRSDAAGFAGCNYLRWAGWSGVWFTFFPNDPYPLCIEREGTFVVQHYYGYPGSPYGCVYQQVQCYTGGSYSNVGWWLPDGAITDDSCLGLKQIGATFSAIGVKGIWAVKPTPGGWSPWAFTQSVGKVGVYTVDAVGAFPPDVLPGQQTLVLASVTPSLGNVEIDLTSYGVDGTGGHVAAFHSQPRHGGSFADSSPVTADESAWVGIAASVYTASPVGGSEEIVATACDYKVTSNVTVQVPGLAAMAASANEYYILWHNDNAHPSYHYVTPTVRDALEAIAEDYHADYPADEPLHYNDCSLVWGGLFDVPVPVPSGPARWTTPHTEHREGLNVDVRKTPIPADHRAGFQAIVRRHEGEADDHGDHYHLEF